MPTSLTFIILVPEVLHIGDLMGMWVQRVTKITLPPSDFQGPTRAFWTPQEGWCFAVMIPDSRGNSRPYKEKQTLPGTLADIFEVVCLTTPDDVTRIMCQPVTLQATCGSSSTAN
ncbi:rRNA promoter binding protein [Echinococcus multilocularis]|uniref:rRNA promoter binding protein n=1 Tax=Echinococcus multilocularis TaxID=6211 RepID=A0A0S4MIP3_ECHMU|nr:rRNA promoter binding protein [Echinococcus multilocularis]